MSNTPITTLVFSADTYKVTSNIYLKPLLNYYNLYDHNYDNNNLLLIY